MDNAQHSDDQPPRHPARSPESQTRTVVIMIAAAVLLHNPCVANAEVSQSLELSIHGVRYSIRTPRNTPKK
eukprot:6220265-Amphidinium_carterae.1